MDVSEWPKIKLKEVFDLSSGKTKPNDIVNVMDSEHPYPVYGGNGIIGYSGSLILNNDAIVIGRVGAYCGTVRYVNEKCWVTDNAIYTNSINEDYDPRFLKELLSFKKLHRLRNKGGQPLISQKPIYNLRLSIPYKSEQIKIRKALSIWDEAISKAEKLIQAKKQYKKGLMQRLLTGKVRFPEFEGDEWIHVKLGDIFIRIRDKNEGKAENVLTISSKGGFLDQTDKFGGVIAGKNLENYTYIERGDFAYNKGNSLTYPQGCIFKLEDYDHAAVPNVYYCFRAYSKTINTDFYKYYFELGLLNRQLKKVINKGVRNDGLLNLSAKDFFKLKVKKPPYYEQKKIAEAIEPIDKEIELLSKKLSALKKQKKGLTQKLLTGKIRVNNLEIA